ncbi:MAG: hypothetical protein RIS64_2011 [Bacteroidota bacterium]|jgi:hypothetical protein
MSIESMELFLKIPRMVVIFFLIKVIIFYRL